MTSTPARAAHPTTLSPAVVGVTSLAVVHLATAAWMALAPRSFFETVGPFGSFNTHYVRDMASMTAGVGIALAAALAWPVLRAGAVAAAAATAGFHAVNHWVDLSNAHAGSPMGVIDAISQTALLAACLVVLHLLADSGRDRASR